ncbi:hypothetical protein ELI13_04010 [Rhizobium ruizarguesonis]|nr:hypothetical protein ELI13_04010 [Rhizobium ruizarguesonis]
MRSGESARPILPHSCARHRNDGGEVERRRLPLTLTLSPYTGRGDVPRESLVGTERMSLRPVHGEKVAAAG